MTLLTQMPYRWLPGQLLTSVAPGGNSTAHYSDARTTVAGYLVIAAGVALTLFKPHRRHA